MNVSPLQNAAILQKVMILALYQEPVRFPMTVDDPHARLMMVCSQWRQVIRSLPCLWDRIIFTHRAFNTAHNLLRQYRSIIRFSALRPLSFVFLTDYCWEDQGAFADLQIPTQHLGNRRISVVNEMIRPVVGRLQYLSVILTHTEVFNLLSIRSDAFTSLRAIKMNIIDSGAHGVSSFIIKDEYPFNSLPQIRYDLYQLVNGLNFLHIDFTWNSITKLNLGNMAISPLSVMRLMYFSKGSLTEAYLCVQFDANSANVAPRHNQPFTMTNLTQLRLELIDASFYPAFLLALRLPVLEDLWIHQATSSLPSLSWDVGFYSTWFARTKRASKSLKRLNLSDSQLGPTMHGRLLRSATSYSGLQKLLKNFSQLHSLSLATGICVHLPILDMIAKGQLLPQLQVLHLATASDPHAILEMVRTRNTGSSSKEWECIKSLMLTLPDAFSDQKDELEKEAALLGLDKGLLMHFVLPCTIQGCASMCCFGV